MSTGIAIAKEYGALVDTSCIAFYSTISWAISREMPGLKTIEAALMCSQKLSSLFGETLKIMALHQTMVPGAT